MSPRSLFRLACVGLLSLCCGVARGAPMFYNVSMDASGDDGLEFLFPRSFSTREPVQVSAATLSPEASDTPTLTNSITTTIIRLKDFVLTRVVDFLEENLLIIVVVTSLLIVMVFIICCASAMSQKRKLEAYKAPTQPSKKHPTNKSGGRRVSDEVPERPYAVDHVKRVHTQGGASSPKNLRVPSKGLIGERGRDVRSSPRQVREAEEAEKRREEPRRKEQPKRGEEAQHASAAPVCTCHLKKGHH
ncbi:transmembrane protein 119 [Syngnathoides biaculeatus]|uniref:transmembrane protein 119 n=1 Tax=Syngnathoides biaculeatus TaxID=300417 RepID=UPI002ADE8F0B|nr:transmembrane protein 119 [Syngnathoides biaculeatus]